jgi:NAD(P)-dependent dehydrogenase (short-subunit alcohol dehydrogenase family)
MDWGIKGKTFLITGARSGIGRATALQFKNAGANIIVIDLSWDKDSEIEGATHLVCDLSKYDSIEKNFKEWIETYNPDGIVNNAGVGIQAPVSRLKKEDIQTTLQVNLSAVFQISQIYLTFRKKKGGVIVNIGSVLGFVGAGTSSIYSASKGGVMAMTRALAVEYGKYGFRINAVAPGVIPTNMTKKLLDHEKLKSHNLSLIPMNRFGEPDEIANAILFLSSPYSSYINGHSLVVDGGLIVQ